MHRTKVILVTDGDSNAKRAVEAAASNVGGRCISASAGNPTPLTGYDIIQLIKTSATDPVIVMVDDRGRKGEGLGEAAMREIINEESIDVLGVVAVSSKGKDCRGINVTCSITKTGEVISGAVDKYGNDIGENDICGDTLSILKGKKKFPIVGLGDPGKMDYMDDASKGAPVTTKAIQEILRLSENLS